MKQEDSSKRLTIDNAAEIDRVRRICLALPETIEKLSHGEPTFFVGKKVFAMCSNNHHNDGHIAVTIPTAIGVQAALIESDAKKFYKPPYVGVRGWVGIELKQVSDAELSLYLQEAWRLIAPPKLQQRLPDSFVKTEVTIKENRSRTGATPRARSSKRR